MLVRRASDVDQQIRLPNPEPSVRAPRKFVSGRGSWSSASSDSTFSHKCLHRIALPVLVFFFAQRRCPRGHVCGIAFRWGELARGSMVIGGSSWKWLSHEMLPLMMRGVRFAGGSRPTDPCELEVKHGDLTDHGLDAVGDGKCFVTVSAIRCI